jgi:hypothetical protein
MHNLWMNARRYKALLLAVLPFLIAGWLFLLVQTAESWDSIAYLMILIAGFPVLVTMSVLSVVFAFNKKDPNRKYIRTTKVASIISVTAFAGVLVIGMYGAITSIL